MYFVKAGYRTLNLNHLILLEDGREEPQPKAIPASAVRATLTTGRDLDFDGSAADVLRRQVRQVTVQSEGIDPATSDVPGHDPMAQAAPGSSPENI